MSQSKPKERPILFSAPMVRAIFDGKKTQTRRVILRPERFTRIRDCEFCCPYGQPGDRLWVREDFRAKSWSADGGWGEIEYRDGRFRLINGAPWSFADAYPQKHPVDRWRSARFMPRWASRLTLEVVSVRVERLQEISEEDARAEGIARRGEGSGYEVDGIIAINARAAFEMLWERINGADSWAKNPWVWVVEFKRLEVAP